ncbi:hypothetical protein ISF_00769 [Cordyceps fumosorosea ARSEF 2679]|uniref:Uncharacterized protein n=1 Tax=Cordyceps fumosorosea (strain ARSEF 2679) TaxID=1081104 RepID=A0A168EJ12_CORFA|nr:hypothetical protein ISF_00769 [Cordyceps fumosorosea ARSEF 2679]OAA73868.1 hypothetical protein ISF_00769 [Cordyceps fumosorosea ARSEF 2679]
MAIPWATIRSLSLVLGPFLVPRAIAYYRSSRANSRSAGVTVRAAPRRVLHAVFVLVLVALVLAAFATLPPLTPENLFRRTASRLQIPNDVLFARVAALRPGGALTAADEALRARFVNLESRLLYLRFGPAALAGCAFCVPDEPRSYLCHAAPRRAWRTSTPSTGARARAAERLESVNRALQGAKSKMSALGIVKNTAQRDAELRGRSDAYWTHEVRLMAEAMEEREVIECVSDALENRVDIQTITRDADSYTSLVLQDLAQE